MEPRLDNLKVLFLDCQATGASPPRGSLLEIGWAAAAAGSIESPFPEAVDSYLVRPPEGAAIPAAVTRVTGIEAEKLKTALLPEPVWQRLDVSVRAVAAEADQNVCPAVIHFARFEIPFLRNIYARFAPDRPFPLQVVCTHEIARRILPGLPRKGLRAVAGYFGHAVGSQRRCSVHVQATAVIWRHLVRELRDNHSVESWEALRAWLESTAPPQRAARSYPLNPVVRQDLPDQPGIYRMRRGNGDLLYVGKAKSLKKRVNGYFRPKARHPEHTLEMLSQARRLDVTTTATALEAAVLECDQIKELQPPYNVALKNAERQLLYCAHDLSCATASLADGRWAGPFPSTRDVDSLLALARWWCKPDRTAAEIGLDVLNLPQARQPPPECTCAGLDLFYKAHADSLVGKSPLRAIAAIGARLWQNRLTAAEHQDDTPTDDQPHEQSAADAKDRAWTPESVQRAIENIICHSAHMLRRARWFCIFSESNLVWETPEKDRPHRLVSIRNGHLSDCRDHKPGQDLPVPPQHDIPQRQRQRQLDLPTYDRLRVLTTEIRRLVAENRFLAICLGPGRIIAGKQMVQLLKWV